MGWGGWGTDISLLRPRPPKAALSISCTRTGIGPEIRGCPIMGNKDSAVSEAFGQDYNLLIIDMVESASPSSIEGALMSWDSREVNFWYPGENKKRNYHQTGAGDQCGRGAENILGRG